MARAAIASRAGGDPAHDPLADLVSHHVDAVVTGYEPGAIGAALGQLPSRGRQPLLVLGEHRLQRLLRCLVTARASAAIILDSARLSGLRASAQADGSQAGKDHRVDAYAHASMLRRPRPDPGLRPVAKPERPGNSLSGDLAGLDARGAHVHALGRTADRDAAALDVRVPAAAGTAVRERDVVAEDRPLAAYVADGSHSSLHLT